MVIVNINNNNFIEEKKVESKPVERKDAVEEEELDDTLMSLKPDVIEDEFYMDNLHIAVINSKYLGDEEGIALGKLVADEEGYVLDALTDEEYIKAVEKYEELQMIFSEEED